MNNMQIYNAARAVPAEAKKTISGGRLNGKTDINPMWRIKALTEQFGPCGIGWKYEILGKNILEGANGEVAAFVDILLYYKHEGEWSEGIPGTGGSMLVSKEKSGLYTSDECFKMALTDAISVSCKALGVGADVYWDKDKTKYDKREEAPAMSYDDAIKVKASFDEEYKDMTLAEIWKKGVKIVDDLRKNPDATNEFIEAVNVVQRELNRRKAEKAKEIKNEAESA